ncbi:hypothetical protein AciX9_4570 (plasmid) [Granulicella tundricola MP5ACTX9]|uniref:Uncharacterized protein n=1 Tax=Granulicella tundricola (strain ATCC BAA-1859 / DSM 23138 / MP5ACTX9) TaxID=1198114 RepID=E8X7R7_GRATM|nr:hypothetical protein AciX9_4570 [Granulicella tundricola MP5ACTX9]
MTGFTANHCATVARAAEFIVTIDLMHYSRSERELTILRTPGSAIIVTKSNAIIRSFI